MPFMNDRESQSSAKVFFALWPTASGRAGLSKWQMPLQQICGGRLMREDTLHATLVFVGEVEPHRLEALQLAAREAGGERFDLCFSEARYWGHNHIVYAAPSDVPLQLGRLVDTLERNLVRHRFKLERREFKPHVTLLRDAHWSDTPLPAMDQVCWKAADFVLVQSLREAGQAAYRVLERFPLHVTEA